MKHLLGLGTEQVHFSMQDLEGALETDLYLGRLSERTRRVEHALLSLHHDGILQLQQGLAVFRQALQLRYKADAPRRFTDEHYRPVQLHQRERNLQIHVMGAYAEAALQSQTRANQMASAWFRMERSSWLRRYLPGQAQELERPTGIKSWKKIVEDLGDPVQMSIVTASAEKHLLVLAGPGSGKTRTLVHRVGWLLRVERVNARGVVVLCFNRSAAREVRRRLRDLVGEDAGRVTVSTFHAFALRILGRGLREGEEEPDLGQVIPQATEILEGRGDLADERLAELVAGGITHILVDEYQDVQAASYQMLCALAKKRADGEQGDAVLLAVGDDDQSIYDFLRRKSQEKEPVWTWIQRFSEDFEGKTRHLLANYRSEAPILEAAQAVISLNQGRMKKDQVLVLNKARLDVPNRWARLDPIGQGRVTRLRAAGPAAMIAELRRIKAIEEQSRWEDFAILSRSRAGLRSVRAALEEVGIPCRWPLTAGERLPLWDLREVVALRDRLEGAAGQEGYCQIGTLKKDLAAGPWRGLLRALLEEAEVELGQGLVPMQRLRAELWEGVLQERREAAVGSGVRLATLHGAKGLEFNHVFLMDGGWEREEVEEERRLVYVGMTRARYSLCLMDSGAVGHPAWAALDTLPGLRRERGSDSPWPKSSWKLLSPAELDLGYAASFAEDHPLHRVLAGLQQGALLELKLEGERGYFFSGTTRVARLSVAGHKRLAPVLQKNSLRARVLAITVRRKGQMEPEWQGRCRVDRWELPVVEIWEEG